jgi:1-acyl-sn-glycerol-3-phosphate acyltransferase
VTGRASLWPFAKVVASTLAISARIVVHDRLGRLRPDDVDRWLVGWHEGVFRAGDGSIIAEGLSHVADAARGPDDVAAGRRSYVVMTNHQSLLDVPSIIATFPGRIRMVGKYELGELPVWGQAMKAAGIVFVDRGNRAQSVAALDGAKAQLREGTSIWIAPEGTRSRDGTLLPLKKGGFHLALQLGVPIAPAWIAGTREIIHPSGFGVVKGGHVVVRYGPPIPTRDAAGAPKDLATLMDEVRAALLALSTSSST